MWGSTFNHALANRVRLASVPAATLKDPAQFRRPLQHESHPRRQLVNPKNLTEIVARACLVLSLLEAAAIPGVVLAQSVLGSSPTSVIAVTNQSSDAQVDAQSDTPPPPVKQSLEEAWWTGPVIAKSAAPLPKGRMYFESYLYDAKSAGVSAVGSQTYLLYGLTDRLTIGVRPLFGYTLIDGGGSSSHPGVGDLELHAHYALTTYTPDGRMPAIAIAVDQSLPIGRYDRLDKSSNGFGTGAYTTTFGIYAQDYFWLGNGRLLRGRLNFSWSLASRTDVRGLSVYESTKKFDGTARPGGSLAVDNSWEYSITRNWVLAIDFYYRHDAPTSIYNTTPILAKDLTGHAFDTFAVAPAIEYNWSSRVGVICGVRLLANRGNDSHSITPLLALSVLL